MTEATQKERLFFTASDWLFALVGLLFAFMHLSLGMMMFMGGTEFLFTIKGAGVTLLSLALGSVSATLVVVKIKKLYYVKRQDINPMPEWIEPATNWLVLLGSIFVFLQYGLTLLNTWTEGSDMTIDGFLVLASLYFIYTRARRLFIRKNVAQENGTINIMSPSRRMLLWRAAKYGVLASFISAAIPTIIIIGRAMLHPYASSLRKLECYAFLIQCIQSDRGQGFTILGAELLLFIIGIAVWKSRTIIASKERILFFSVFIVVFLAASYLMSQLMAIPLFITDVLLHGFV